MFERDGDKSLKEDLLDYGYSFTSSEWKKFDDKIKSDILMNFRLAYLTDGDVNWCEELGTVLANDEIIDGVSERGMAYITEVAYSRPITLLKKMLTNIILIISITSAARNPLIIICVFSFFISNSRAASSTISISPIVPRTGTRLSRNSKLL